MEVKRPQNVQDQLLKVQQAIAAAKRDISRKQAEAQREAAAQKVCVCARFCF